MEYRHIVAVTGLSGLYQLISTKNDGAIVKNLADNCIKFVSARKHQVTPLESIEIYTYEDNVKLHDVFEQMKEKADEAFSLNMNKDTKAAKTFLKTIVPNYDEDRVYTSDIKKLLKWFEILHKNDLLNFDYLKTNNIEEVEIDEN